MHNPVRDIRSFQGAKSIQMGMIGLGRMGANMVRRLLKGGHQCMLFDMSPAAMSELTTKDNAVGSHHGCWI
jgi:6-phosphogluconate dehydrogenase (decarboxylating)